MINAPANGIINSYIGFQKNMPLYSRINDLLSMPIEYSSAEEEKLISISASGSTRYGLDMKMET
jgi:hypothetical protein